MDKRRKKEEGRKICIENNKKEWKKGEWDDDVYLHVYII